MHIPYWGDIAFTDLLIPYNEISAQLNELPEYKDAKIVLYCCGDSMSMIIIDGMVSLGYTNIWNQDGDFNSWVEAGLLVDGR